LNIAELLQAGDTFVSRVNAIEADQIANQKVRATLESQIVKLKEEAKGKAEALDIATHAIEILRELSDDVVSKAYAFLEETLNDALAKMFVNTTRRIKLNETLLRNQYPQLEIELYVTNGKKRTLKGDSGHGIAQIISLLSILALIVMTKSRRLLVLDEVISGLSVRNRMIITEILWAFTEIGFQFVVNEHGYIPEGAKVYHLEMVGDVSSVKRTYISKRGVYLDNDPSYTSSEKEAVIEPGEEDEVTEFNLDSPKSDVGALSIEVETISNPVITPSTVIVSPNTAKVAQPASHTAPPFPPLPPIPPPPVPQPAPVVSQNPESGDGLKIVSL
jgi:hypothetical protein